MKDFSIDQANNISFINSRTIKIEKLEFRWRVTVDDTVEFTIESADQLPDWIIKNYDRPIGWSRIISVIDSEDIADG